MQLVGFIGDSKMSVSVNEMLHESKVFKLYHLVSFQASLSKKLCRYFIARSHFKIITYSPCTYLSRNTSAIGLLPRATRAPSTAENMSCVFGLHC